MKTNSKFHFQSIISSLNDYWTKAGCTIIQPVDLPVGAGTFHRFTFLESLTKYTASYCYVQSCRRPSDGRYGRHPNRLQHYYQYQVIIRPSPQNIQDLYTKSISALGIDLTKNDLRFVEDNWQSPTLGATGMGWEIWLNGMEVSQFTYFQKVAGKSCELITAEITYGLERLAMYLQEVDDIFDLVWSYDKINDKTITYRDLFQQSEDECSSYNFALDSQNNEISLYDKIDLLTLFNIYKKSCKNLLKNHLTIPAYEQSCLLSHTFNIMDARRMLSVAERQQFILDIRELTKECAIQQQEKS